MSQMYIKESWCFLHYYRVCVMCNAYAIYHIECFLWEHVHYYGNKMKENPNSNYYICME